MKNGVLIICCLLAVVQGLTIEKYHVYKPRVVNGKDVKLGEIPYQVSLNHGGHFCGGSIVNEYWVITAAHCVHRKADYLVKVIAGTVDLNFPYSSHQVEQIIIHQNYIPVDSGPEDIALLKVVKPFEFSFRIQPVILPDPHVEIMTNSPVIVSGWGNIADGSLPDLLQKARIYITDQETCRAVMNESGFDVYPSQICASDPNASRGECNGDSGSPLTSNGVLMGIVSWSIKSLGCASPSYPSVYTRVSEYVEWIHKHTKLTSI